MKTICVIGCGWLGLPMAIHLRSKGYDVIGTTTRAERFPQLTLHGIRASIFVLGQGAPPQADIYIINIPPSKTRDYRESMIGLAESIPTSSHVLFISTTSVYLGLEDVIPESRILPGLPMETQKGLTSTHSTTPITDLIHVEGSFWNGLGGRNSIFRCGGLIGPGREPGRFLAGKKNVPNPDTKVSITPLDMIIERTSDTIIHDRWGELANVIVSNRPTRREFYTKAALDLGLEPPEFVND